MRPLFLTFLLSFSLFLSACSGGKATLPELGAALVSAIKKGSEAQFKKLIPTQEQFGYFYEKYLWHNYENAEKAKQAGLVDGELMQGTLKDRFNTLVRMSRIGGFETSKMQGSVSGISEQKDNANYGTGTFTVDVTDGRLMRKIIAKAVFVEGRWYIIDDLYWKAE